jgi:hypothetical protein
MEEVSKKFKSEVEKCKKYLDDGTDSSELNDLKQILDRLKGKVEGKDFERFRVAYDLQAEFFSIA